MRRTLHPLVLTAAARIHRGLPAPALGAIARPETSGRGPRAGAGHRHPAITSERPVMDERATLSAIGKAGRGRPECPSAASVTP